MLSPPSGPDKSGPRPLWGRLHHATTLARSGNRRVTSVSSAAGAARSSIEATIMTDELPDVDIRRAVTS